jgi:hypothetical protein
MAAPEHGGLAPHRGGSWADSEHLAAKFFDLPAKFQVED